MLDRRRKKIEKEKVEEETACANKKVAL